MTEDQKLIERARELSAWLSANNIDMKMPDGMIDPAALADRLEASLREREGWKMVPVEPTPSMLERAAFNLCAEYGVEFVQPLGGFVKDAYCELISASPALGEGNG